VRWWWQHSDIQLTFARNGSARRTPLWAVQVSK
jgi:hypothetical protein